ncbi:hypothetical protein RJ639_033794 [Escallonia herrerae]|uniref:Uncharacterized protein n=1 Tax=Escallonia herrerae TaxID=1293975 RepID=A0AA88WUS9_9ASTE|nr:hypothetical protein RJ639_033794 [Escallonia herrerae]
MGITVGGSSGQRRKACAREILDLSMRIGMELEFDKYCVVGGSPDTVLPSPRPRSKVEKRKGKGRPKCGDDLSCQNADFREIRLHRYRSASCKSIPSRRYALEGEEVLKRGSVYQSSKEIGEMKRTGAVEGRRKIELPRCNATTFSVGIADSLCSSDEDSSLAEQKRSSMMSQNSESNASINKPDIFPDFLDLSLSPVSEKAAGIGITETDSAHTLHKSLSAKLELPHSPCRSDSDCSKSSSPKTRFSPIRKMFDPFVKSKSQRSPLGSTVETAEVTPSGLGTSRQKTLRKSLLHDFSNTARGMQCDSQLVKKEIDKSLAQCSAVHLHGLLKLGNKHGEPFFEFMVKFPEDALVAKTWRVGNAMNWVYTFHAAHNKRKSNASGWGLKDTNKESSMLGQMQVSCHLCTELKDAGAFDNSMLTEFVLYDIVHARKNFAAQDNLCPSADVAKPPKGSIETSSDGTCKLDKVTDPTRFRLQPKHVSESGHNDLSTHPWEPADLHPSLEIAAIIIETPFEKRESLKWKRAVSKSDQPLPDLLDTSGPEQIKKGISDCLSPAKVNAVIPSGNHSLPTTDSCGPSPLLDRWRLGGGCDCGGWDMGCPLLVCGNPNLQRAEDHPFMENQRPLELFVEGTKEKAPALRMTVTQEGHYAVDFHAQLTTLQAFSICVAILHGTEASIAVGQERDKQLLQCNSLRVFIGEEVKYLMEAVVEEERRKVSKKMEETPPSFVLNPPFSPIARV